jgi:hypothetical protein
MSSRTEGGAPNTARKSNHANAPYHTPTARAHPPPRQNKSPNPLNAVARTTVQSLPTPPRPHHNRPVNAQGAGSRTGASTARNPACDDGCQGGSAVVRTDDHTERNDPGDAPAGPGRPDAKAIGQAPSLTPIPPTHDACPSPTEGQPSRLFAPRGMLACASWIAGVSAFMPLTRIATAGNCARL